MKWSSAVKWHSLLRPRAILAAGLVFAASAARAAAPLEDKVPGDSLIYAGWAGSDSLQGQYAGSNLKAIIEASTIRSFISDQLPKLISKANDQDPNAADQIGKLQTGLSIVWHHPAAFYFEPLGLSNPNQPEPHIGILCDAGADAKTLVDLLNDALKQAPPPPDVPITVSQDGTVVKFLIGKPTDSAPLSANPAYIAAMKSVAQSGAAMSVYADIQKILAMANDAITKIPGGPPDAKAKFNAIIDTLGVSGMTQIALQSGFDGKGWSDQSFLGYTGEKKGLALLASGDPISNDMLAAVPKDAASFSASRLDLHKIFSTIRDVIGKADDQAAAQFDQAVAQANQQIGFDIDKDFLQPLGDQWITFRAPLSDEGGLNFALVHKLADGDRFAKSLSTLEDLAAKLAQDRFKIDKVTTDKIQVSSVSYLTYSVAWTIRNGYFYVASLDGIAGAVHQVENKSPSILESDLYKAAMARMPQGIKPQSITYSNPAKLYPELRRGALGLIPIARAAGVDIPASIFPDTSDVAPFMTPGATATWWDADGAHAANHSSFPGAEALAGNPNVSRAIIAIPAMAVGILLPSLGRAREMASRGADAASLRGLVQCCAIYSAKNNDKMPDDLGRLVVDGSISTKQLVSKRTNTQPFEYSPEMQKLAASDFPKFAAALAEHTDYVYLGKGTTYTTDSTIVAAYEKPGPGVIDGINVAFQDNHVEFVRYGALPATFQATNEYLAKNKLPTVDVTKLLNDAGMAGPPVGILVPGMPPMPTPPPANQMP